MAFAKQMTDEGCNSKKREKFVKKPWVFAADGVFYDREQKEGREPV